MGWVILLAVFQTIWLPEDVDSSSQSNDWVLFLGDNLRLAAVSMLLLETHPCVSIGSLGRKETMEEYDASGQRELRAAESLKPVEWAHVLAAAAAGTPMFLQDVVAGMSDDDEEGVPDVPAGRCVHGGDGRKESGTRPTEPKKKKSKSSEKADDGETTCARPSPKPKAAKRAAKPAKSVPAASTPPPNNPASPSPKVSSLKSRLGMASGLRK